MRIAGLPVWALVVLACIVAPFLIRSWVEAEQRRARRRTDSLLEALGLRAADVGAGARHVREAGSPLAASTRRSPPSPDVESDDDEGAPPGA